MRFGFSSAYKQFWVTEIGPFGKLLLGEDVLCFPVCTFILQTEFLACGDRVCSVISFSLHFGQRRMWLSSGANLAYRASYMFTHFLHIEQQRRQNAFRMRSLQHNPTPPRHRPYRKHHRFQIRPVGPLFAGSRYNMAQGLGLYCFLWVWNALDSTSTPFIWTEIFFKTMLEHLF